MRGSSRPQSAAAASALAAVLTTLWLLNSAAATAAGTESPRRAVDARGLLQAAAPVPDAAAATVLPGAADAPKDGGGVGVAPSSSPSPPEPDGGDGSAEDSSGGNSTAAADRRKNNTVPMGPMPPCCQALPAGFPAPGIPAVIVDAQGKTLPANKGRVQGTLCTCGAPNGKDFFAPSTVRIRGSSSAEQQQQKSLALEVLMPTNTSRTGNVEFMGMPSHARWMLYAPETDRTLGLRNWLAYSSARRMGRWAARLRPVEVFLVQDGRPLSRDHYWGMYYAGETVTRGRERVNVHNFKPENVSGGWLLQYENDNTHGNNFFDTRASRLTLLVDYPNNPTQDALLWIKGYMDAFESSLLKGNMTDVAARFDIPAAIDYFLGTELTKNPDGYRGSIKLHKDRGGPLVMGPLWDYDEAFGACCGYPIEGWEQQGASNGTSGGSAISPEGWRFNICNEKGRCKVEPLDGTSQWYRRLWLEVPFRTAAAARWAALRREALSDAWFVNEIASVKAAIAPATDRSFQRWRSALADPKFPNWRAQWDAAIAELQAWLLAHLAWMDKAFLREAAPGAGPEAYLQPAAAAALPAAQPSPIA